LKNSSQAIEIYSITELYNTFFNFILKVDAKAQKTFSFVLKEAVGISSNVLLDVFVLL
jgi:hypothetical protein